MEDLVKKYYKPWRTIEPQRKRDWKRSYVDLGIFELPGPASIRKDNIKPQTRLSYNYADDNYLVKDCSSSKKEYLYWGIGFFIMFLISVSLLCIPYSLEGLAWSLIFVFLFLIPSMWAFILAFYLPKEKKIIFDRQRGLVQLPGAFWNESQLVRFEEMHVTKAMRSRAGGLELVIARFNKRYDNLAGPLYLTFGYASLEQSWSFLVWYMDKNRPLPPSEALDPYRERDYERRKKDGFISPLYPSKINTPEYNTREFDSMIKINNEVKGPLGTTLNKLYEVRHKWSK